MKVKGVVLDAIFATEVKWTVSKQTWEHIKKTKLYKT